jgi:hypothetical protein
LSDLREATAMVLAAQVKILEAVTANGGSPRASTSSSGGGGDALQPPPMVPLERARPATTQREPSASNNVSGANGRGMSASMPRPRTSYGQESSGRPARLPKRPSSNLDNTLGSAL